MIMGEGLEDVAEHRDLAFQVLNELRCSPQVVVGQALQGVGASGNLVQVGADAADLLDDAGELLLQRRGEKKAPAEVGQASIAQKGSHSAVALACRLLELEVLLGVEIAGHAVREGAVHGIGG